MVRSGEDWPQRSVAEPAVQEEEAPSEETEHAPGEFDVPEGVDVIEGEPRGGVRPVAIVVSRFNGEFTGRMLDRALEELEEIGV